MVDIFDEVSDDLRTDRAIRVAKRYGGVLLVALVLVLVAVAAQQGWNEYQSRRDAKAAIAYLALTTPLDAGGTLSDTQGDADAKALTNFAATAPQGYKTLSQLRAAGLYADAGQLTQAEGLWNAVANDPDADAPLRQLASLLWAQHALGHAPNADVLARLQPLVGGGNPYHGLAQETEALLYLHEGNNDMAKGLFKQLAADPNSPEGVRDRAAGLLAKLNG